MAQKTDRLVTVFGGGGFIGRYVVQALFARGLRVRIAQRDPRAAVFLKPLAGLGQVQFAAADITVPGQVARATHGSDAVINLVGILKGRFDAIHHLGAQHIAEAAAAAGATSLVQVSAIGADPESDSGYARSKGEGEQAVRTAFPDAVVVRPSIAFGIEDNFVNRFAALSRLLPVVPVIRGKWRLQPVHAADLGRGIALAALDPRSHGGKTYELGGPQVLTMRELNAWICERTGRAEKPLLDIPDVAGRLMARLGGWLPGAPITWDQWLMLQKDNVVSEGAAGFEAFGIRPTPLAAVAEGWLTSYRRSGRFAAKSPY
jgi:NADH dehydrogenase